MRKCRIFSCGHTDGGCCADCDLSQCKNRCKNSPERCNCIGPDNPPERKKQFDSKHMLELAQSGLLYTEIAEIMGCSVTTVNWNLNRMGYFRQPRRRKADESDG